MELVRSENDLTALRIRLGSTVDTRSEVSFEAVEPSGQSEAVARCSTWELGMPDVSVRGTSGTDLSVIDSCALPTPVLSAIESRMGALAYSASTPRNAVWLELSRPRGYLHLVPWERLLAPLGRPVLRLPYHALRPRASSGSVEVVICISAPVAKATFDVVGTAMRMADAWTGLAQCKVRLHIFADAAVHTALVNAAAERVHDIIVHDPHQPTGYLRPRATRSISTSPSVTSPWLEWIQGELGEHAVDAVHFLVHGYISGDRGALAVASTPTLNTDQRLSRFIGAPEMSSFLTQVGAWAHVVSGPPPQNFSPVGLREFADANAQLRPGATLVHEFTDDPHGEQLKEALSVVFGYYAEVPPMPAVTAWLHPGAVAYPAEEQRALHLTEAGHSALIPGAASEVLAEESTPAWVAASTRLLETLQAEWLPERAGESVNPDAAAALQSVSEVFDAHVRKEFGGGRQGP
jgi:hypothetical protein